MITTVNEKSIHINGLSTDQKPVLDQQSNGATYLEMDTGSVYGYNAETSSWVLQSAGNSGGSGTTYRAGDGISISSKNEISVDVDSVKEQLDLASIADSGSYLDLVDTPDIDSMQASIETIENTLEEKQDKLTAGVGVTIIDNVISVLGFHYSKFIFEKDSCELTSVEGEAAVAFNKETNKIDRDKLITIFPFDQIKREYIQLSYADGTNLSGTDKFSTVPNIYYCNSIADDGQTQTIEFASYKAGDNFSRPYEDSNITRVGLGCYLACEDKSNSSNPVLRSSKSINKGLARVAITRAAMENELPYYNGEKVDITDSRVWSLFVAMMKCFIGNRNAQQVYKGICDYDGGNWNYTDNYSNRVSEHVGGTWLCGATDEVTNSTKTLTGEVTSWTEDSVTTQLTVGKRPFAILGIENPYGLLYSQLSGIYHTNKNIYQYQKTSHKDDSTFDTTDCKLLATNLCNTSEGYQSKLACANNFSYPIETTGSDSKLSGDYYYYGENNHPFVVGGAYPTGTKTGLDYLSTSLDMTSAEPSIGCRLSIKY